MPDFLFYLFAFLALASSLLVVTSRSAVNGAMFMILTFVSTAAMFFLLEAFFLGVLQVLVYAGAVMVLFLFIIMLIDVDQARTRQLDRASLIAATVAALALATGVFFLFTRGNPVEPLLQPVPADAEVVLEGSGLPYQTGAAAYGRGLLTKYLLPVQVAGFLLLSALIGVVIISKRLTATGEEAASESPSQAS
jgi:NADH-quinone oxidoreductase subunit J